MTDDRIPAVNRPTAESNEGQAVPEVTISHDQLANGRWRYKTSVTMPLANAQEVREALRLADQIAREEAARRMREDTSL